MCHTARKFKFTSATWHVRTWIKISNNEHIEFFNTSASNYKYGRTFVATCGKSQSSIIELSKLTISMHGAYPSHTLAIHKPGAHPRRRPGPGQRSQIPSCEWSSSKKWKKLLVFVPMPSVSTTIEPTRPGKMSQWCLISERLGWAFQMDGHRLPDAHDSLSFFLSGWLIYVQYFCPPVTGAPRVTVAKRMIQNEAAKANC